MSWTQAGFRDAKLRPNDIPSSKRWTKVIESLAEIDQITMDHSPAEGAGRGYTIYQKQGALPCLAISLPLDGLSADQISGAAALLEQLVDELMGAAGGVQAFIAKWRDGVGPESTPYEQCCGIRGPHTTQREWAGRWLRAVAPDMWIGAELIARVDVASIAEVADVTPWNGGVRLRLRDAGRIAELEERLAELLPDAADRK